MGMVDSAEKREMLHTIVAGDSRYHNGDSLVTIGFSFLPR
jgi:hypothetical protein